MRASMQPAAGKTLSRRGRCLFHDRSRRRASCASSWLHRPLPVDLRLLQCCREFFVPLAGGVWLA
eukprot:scaffold1375_cov96-Isochrysis_galbana.AAC.13